MARERRNKRGLRWQVFSHNESSYERPGQKWVCGKQPRGCPCHIGPDEKGNCRASHECEPVKKDDRWYCTRSKQLGGKCKNGPLPDGSCCTRIEKCTPILSHRSRRAALAYAASVLTLGIIIFFVAGPMRSAFFSPGNSGTYHGSIASECKNCHSAENLSSSNWLESALHPANGVTESHLCLDCHDLGKDALLPHALPKKLMDEKTDEKNATEKNAGHSLTQLAGFKVPQNAKGEIACAVCHQEHRGGDFDIKAVYNTQCQSCHTHSFSSLADGHPQFDGYPYKARLNLKFDHVSHLKKHFPDEDKEIECTACHSADQHGKMMLTKPYAEACSSCHEAQIRGEERSGEKGLLVFSLPGIDQDTLKKKKLDIGRWPEDAEGEITPFMELLLSADEDYVAIRDSLSDLDMLDLADADKQALMSAQAFIWAVKKLYVDIALGGQQAIKERLEASLERELQADEFKNLSAMLPAEFMDATLRSWLPSVYGELLQRDKPDAKYKLGKLVVDEQLAEYLLDNTRESDERVIAGGWYRNNDDFSIYYRPAGHSDNFMQGWLNTSVAKQTETSMAMFDLIADEKAPGACMKCHSVSEQDEQRKMNWLSKRPQAFEHRTVEFRHAAHFSLIDSDGCATCHKLDADADFMASFDSDKADSFHSSFSGMQRETCVECHTPDLAGDTCLSCHSYHIGVFEPTKNTKLMKP